MKNPLNYQVSEFDCGPTTLMNMVSFMYQRKDVPQDVIDKIYAITLDGYHTKDSHKYSFGTSDEAMIQFADWFSTLTYSHDPLSVQVITGDNVSIAKNSAIVQTLQNKGCVVAKVMIKEPHYVLITKIDMKQSLVYLFDPYYRQKPFTKDDIIWTLDHPKEYNCIVPISYMNRYGQTYYSFGKKNQRLCLLCIPHSCLINTL